ncbi:uncharacterized protein [Littorina saxatilis]|uniref:uncharacterized protein n=1 Tax=Littorina saxatilis TaxID=31220 RepID=UPI0038B4224E
MGMGGGAYSKHGGLEGGMSFKDGAFSTDGASRGGGGSLSLTNRLEALLGPTATATLKSLNLPPKPPTVLLKEEMAQSGQSYNYGQGMEMEGGSGYDYDQSGAQFNKGQQGYDQSYGYNKSATYGADASRSNDASGGQGYDASVGGGYGGGTEFGGGGGMRYGGGEGAVVKRGRGRGQAKGGQGQGQARGQVQQRGRERGQSFQYRGGDQGAGGNQAPRGRGRGQGGFGQQGQGQDNRGRGRGQGRNYSGGDGTNNYSNYEEQDNTYCSYDSQNQTQNQTGDPDPSRGGYQSPGNGGQGDQGGQGQGQARGQVQQRGRERGQSFQYRGGDQGAGGNQAPRGRGRGQGGFGQQGQGQDNRGRGRGQGGNYSGGDGTNNYSNYEEQDNTYCSYDSQNQTQNQKGDPDPSRGGYQSPGKGGQGDQGGQGQGQARGQVQQRGRERGQSFQYRGGDQGAGGNQAPRGRGRGQGGFGQQGQGQDNRGRGRGQGGNYSGGDGTNNYSNYEEQDNTYSSYDSQNQTQNQTGDQNPSRGGYQSPGKGGQGDARGRGHDNQRGGGFGRGSTAGLVQAVSRGRGGPAGKPTPLMDIVVDSAYICKSSKTLNVALSPETAAFNQFLEFFLTCPDRVNCIQTIDNAKTASRLSVKVEFETERLSFISKPHFTGVLKVGGVFLTRGLGLNIKAVKHDCYERAVQILRNSSLEEILALEDCGKEALREEVERQSKDDIKAFKPFLSQKQAGEVDVSQQIPTAAVSESQPAKRNVPLVDKMMMLLIEEVGKAGREISMASRYDLLCFKVGIRVTALYKVVDLKYNRQYNTSPYEGDPDINLICEIYYDDVLIGQGEGRPRKEAQIAAYNSIQSRLMKEPVSQIAQGPKIPLQPEALPNFFEIIHKGAKPQSGNNHHRMMLMRSDPPDLTKSMVDMVIIELVGYSVEDKAYRILQYSASRNSMLLEWKQLDKGENGFRCEMSVNGQMSVTGMGVSKPKACNAAAAMILTDLYMSNDVISFEAVEDLTKATPLEEITARAEALKLDGPPRKERVENVWHEEALSAKKKTADTPEEALSQKQKWMANPLQPWFEDAIVEMMENHAKKLTLEELIIGPGITPEMRRFVTAAAKHCLLVSTTKDDPIRGSFVITHQRSIVPEEMAMILRINKGASGRYKLVRDNKQISVLQRALFVRNFPDIWRARAKASLEADKVKKGEVSTTSDVGDHCYYYS